MEIRAPYPAKGPYDEPVGCYNIIIMIMMMMIIIIYIPYDSESQKVGNRIKDK